MINFKQHQTQITNLKTQITHLKSEKEQLRSFLHELIEAFYKTVNSKNQKEPSST
jgi:hypothetical protein